jgi:hypothetical protein
MDVAPMHVLTSVCPCFEKSQRSPHAVGGAEAEVADALPEGHVGPSAHVFLEVVKFGVGLIGGDGR